MFVTDYQWKYWTQAERWQAEGCECAMLALMRIEYRHELGQQFKSDHPSFRLLVWENNITVYDYEN